MIKIPEIAFYNDTNHFVLLSLEISPKTKVAALTEHVMDKLESFTTKECDFEKDDCFSWIDNIFGIGQQATNIIGLANAHIFGFYYFYLYFCSNSVDKNSLIFGKFLK